MTLKHIADRAKLNFIIGFFVSLAICVPVLFRYLGFHFIAFNSCDPTMAVFLLLVILGVVYAFGGIGYISSKSYDEEYKISFLPAIGASIVSSFAYILPICVLQLVMAFIALVLLHDKYVLHQYFDTKSFNFDACVPFTNYCFNLFGTGMTQQVAGIIYVCIVLGLIFSIINSVIAICFVLKTIWDNA